MVNAAPSYLCQPLLFTVPGLEKSRGGTEWLSGEKRWLGLWTPPPSPLSSTSPLCPHFLSQSRERNKEGPWSQEGRGKWAPPACLLLEVTASVGLIDGLPPFLLKVRRFVVRWIFRCILFQDFESFIEHLEVSKISPLRWAWILPQPRYTIACGSLRHHHRSYSSFLAHKLHCKEKAG